MSGEDPAAPRVRRMLPSVSEVLKELTARAPIEPDVAFRVAREVCAEELKRIRDAGGDSVPLEELVQRALKRATGGVPAPPPVVEPVPEPAPPEPREDGAVEDPFAETTGAMDLRWDRDVREPFSEPQPPVPSVGGELPAGAATAVEAPVLPPLSFDAAPAPEPQPVFLDVPEAPEGIGDETLNRLSREAESIDLQSVFTKESGPASAPLAATGGDAAEPAVPEPFEDDEDTVLTVPRGRGGKEGGPRVGVILAVVGALAALGGLGYLLAGLWMERDDVPPPVAVARPRPEARPAPDAVRAATVESSPEAAPATAPEPAVSPAAALEAPKPTAAPAVPTAAPASEAVAPAPAPARVTLPVRQSRDGYMVTRDRAGQPEVYSIHFTSYQDRATAERDLERVSALVGRKGYVAEIDLGAKGVWQRVMIGAFPTAEEAKAVRAELAAKGTRDLGWVYRVVAPD